MKYIVKYIKYSKKVTAKKGFVTSLYIGKSKYGIFWKHFTVKDTKMLNEITKYLNDYTEWVNETKKGK